MKEVAVQRIPEAETLWFLPDGGSETWVGRLAPSDSLHPIQLALTHSESIDPDSLFGAEVLLGGTTHGTVHLAVIGCHSAGQAGSSAGVRTTALQPDFVLLGAHIDDVADVQWTDAWVVVPGSNEWRGNPSLSFDFDPTESSWEARFQPVQATQLYDADGLSVRVESSPGSIPSGVPWSGELHLREQVQFGVRCDEPRALAELAEIVRRLEDWIALATLHPTGEATIDVRLRNGKP